MEHALIGGNGSFMTTGGKQSFTVEDIERLPEGERAEERMDRDGQGIQTERGAPGGTEERADVPENRAGERGGRPDQGGPVLWRSVGEQRVRRGEKRTGQALLPDRGAGEHPGQLRGH